MSTAPSEAREIARLREENTRFRLNIDEMENLARAVHARLSILRPPLGHSRVLLEHVDDALEKLEGILGNPYTNRRGELDIINHPNRG